MNLPNRTAQSAKQLTLRFGLPALLIGLTTLVAACKNEQPKPEDRVTEATMPAHKHGPGESCFIEDASKRDPGRLWCKEHGRYEDRCWECHPELRDAKRPYCDEHGLYEDECFLCDPSRAKAKAPTNDAGAEASAPNPDSHAEAKELFCNEHNLPEHDCGICQPELIDSLPPGKSLSVRLPSDKSAELAGLEVARPLQGEIATSMQLLGEIRFHGNRLARITPLASGVLAKVNVDVGHVAKEGEVLAVVNSPEVAKARADYLSAQADLKKWQAAVERQRLLFEDKVGSRRAMEEAEASHRQAQVANRLARQRLKNLGLRESELRSITDSRSAHKLRAPFEGSVVNRSAVLGEAVDTNKALFEIADLSEMWIELSVPVDRASQLTVGTPLRVNVRSLKGESVEGKITWVSPVTDERTRLVRARGAVPNDNGALRHGMFADVTPRVGSEANGLRVPASAVHRINNLPFVFIRLETDLFAARRVEAGDRSQSDEVTIRAGLSKDEDVVVTGGFSIKSALLASRLGAGCTDD